MALRGKSALVTGSTSGIGLGIARALAAEGADVMLNGFGEAAAIAGLREEIGRRSGVRVGYAGANVSKPAEIREMIAHTVTELGGCDILVNNAGVQHTAPIEQFPDDEWDRILAINLSGAFHAIKAVAPWMKRRGWGRIINVASVHGLVASGEKAAYVAAKHGLVGLTKVAAIELAADGITCNAICPGWVLTTLVQRQIDARAEREHRDVSDVSQDLLAEKQPLRRFTNPEQIGALVVFLCSDAAATMTGAPFSVDGGWAAQ